MVGYAKGPVKPLVVKPVKNRVHTNPTKKGMAKIDTWSDMLFEEIWFQICDFNFPIFSSGCRGWHGWPQ